MNIKSITKFVMTAISVIILFGCSSDNDVRISAATENGAYIYSFPDYYQTPEDADPEWDLAMEAPEKARSFFLFIYEKDEIEGYTSEDILDFHVEEMSAKTESEFVKEMRKENLLIKVYKNTSGGVVMSSYLSVKEDGEGVLFTMQTCPFEDAENSEPEFLEIIKSARESDAA